MPPQFNFCTQPWANLFLHNSGRIQPCCMNSTSIGNIHQHNINDIWNGDRIKQIRDHILKKEYAKAGCKTGCPVQYQLEQGIQPYSFPLDWETSAQSCDCFGKNFERFREGLDKRLLHVSHLPLWVDVQPTEACNMACIMCHQQHRKKERIPSELITRFLDWTEAMHTLRFQGGEIFLDSDMSLSLLKLKRRFKPHQQLHVITNGSLLNEKSIRELMAPPNPIRFIVSIDAVEPDTYKKIRQSSLFHRAWKTMTLMAELQKNMGKNDIVQWNYVVMKSNFHQIEEAVRIAAKIGINISFQPIIGPYPEENIFDNPAIRPEGALEQMEGCRQLASALSAPNVSLENICRQLQLPQGEK